jgi:ATP-binding cassette subfamily B protein
MLWLVFDRVMTIGEFFSLLIYSFFVFGPLSEFGTVAVHYQEAKTSMGTVAAVLDQKPEEVPQNQQKPGKISEIGFRNVSFRYREGARPSVENIDVVIQSGQTVAFVGPSGSGKTTLVKLIVGLYRPQAGLLMVNGIDMNTLDRHAYRGRIGYVSQDTQLFAGTIRENLLFVRPDASDVECLAAMHAAAAEPILARGGNGLDTRIGESGLKLSGGERQRLAIARALLRNPDLVIFDEATSNLDSITEKKIIETIRSIRSLRPNMIMVLIAHRLSTVVHADRICVLERGRIAEQGTHSELLERKGLYAALWREQSAERSDSISSERSLLTASIDAIKVEQAQ